MPALSDVHIPADWDPWQGLTDRQQAQLRAYERELLRFNRTHNLVSPAAAKHFRAHHLKHVLALRWKSFPAGCAVVDWGTGGGLPAIPLAIAFPEVTVHAIDAVRKKVQAVRIMARRLELENLEVWHGRAEDWPGRAHYSVSRATAPLADLWQWHARVALAVVTEDDTVWPPGLVCLKGGNLRDETRTLEAVAPQTRTGRVSLASLGRSSYFRQKCALVVHT